MMSEEYTEIKIKKDLIDRIQKHIQGTEFISVEEYVMFVLEEVIKENDGEEHQEVFSEEDEVKVKGRLRALGYLD
jgi:hypothetical protein